MDVVLLNHTPLWVAAFGIRMSHNSFDKGDSFMVNPAGATCPICGNKVEMSTDFARRLILECKECGDVWTKETHIGKKDRELIARVGNKLKHKSVLEQLVYWFDISGISRAALQELVRHRTARLVVKSTRYTLKELKDDEDIVIYKVRSRAEGHKMERLGFEVFTNESMCITNSRYAAYNKSAFAKYLVFTGDKKVDFNSVVSLVMLKESLKLGISNDISKYSLPEAFKTRLQWQIDGRNLQNFLELRSAKDALWEMRKLAEAIFDALPLNHTYLYREFLRVRGYDEYR